MYDFNQYKVYKYSSYLKIQKYLQLLIVVIGKMYALLSAVGESQSIRPCHMSYLIAAAHPDHKVYLAR